ncbi:MarR family winged helix-turn-helix transcriptional regulator [Sphingomonas abietis]|uniref:MarR family transcriptional regulator n=1 Tax=Sphingomonas abietis TaxID=3012344 RepID=A0ABY7NMV4_9SPHN|nr:MarR family transcriptional regulator [Sphingomonas abietis]WBO22856.1 MarR family transcriptional regulator [Sphingomonas abietis]
MVPQDISLDGRTRVAETLRDYYLRSHRLIDRIMTAQGASFSRAKMLMHIAREGPSRSIDLASSFGFAPRTVTEAIDGLERDGLVRRDPDPDDRRAKRITLTAEGMVVVKAAEAARLEYIDSVFGALSAEECEQIVGLVNKLNDRMAELGG